MLTAPSRCLGTVVIALTLSACGSGSNGSNGSLVTVAAESGVGFTIELGAGISEAEIAGHVSAVLAIAEEFF
jgi:hypothetical protein